MKSPMLLPVENLGSYPTPQPPPPRSWRWLGIVLVLWGLGGIAYFVFRSAAANSEHAAATMRAAQAPVIAVSTEDLLNHVEDANNKVTDVSAKLRRSQDHMGRAVHGLERNDLLIEEQHVRSGMAIQEAGRRELEEARQELELVANSLKEKNLQ